MQARMYDFKCSFFWLIRVQLYLIITALIDGNICRPETVLNPV